MANLDTLDRNDLQQEISDLAREQGVSDQAAWNELADEVIESHLDIAELDPDQDLENIRMLLHEGWAEYQREAGQESSAALSEDPEVPHA